MASQTTMATEYDNLSELSATIPKPAPVLEEIRKAAELIAGSGVREVRAPGTAQDTCSGYYRDISTLAQDVFEFSSRESTPGVYWTIQECDPSVLKKVEKENSLYPHVGKGSCAKDEDISRYAWLPLDFDPVRESKLSSTDAEKDQALKIAFDVRAFLDTNGIPSILADSGNGYHVLVSLDIPNQNGTNKLVEKVLNALNARFGTEAVKIDTGISNPSRILKIYGSVARKGPHTNERPWRTAKLLDVPSNLKPLSEDQLKTLLAEITKELSPQKAAEINEPKKAYEPPVKGTKISQDRNNSVRDYAWWIWNQQTSREPDVEDFKNKVYQFNDDFCDPPLGKEELDRTVLSSTVRKHRTIDSIPIIGGVPAGTPDPATQPTSSTAVSTRPAIDESGNSPYPVWPGEWVMRGTTLYENLVRPAAATSSKYPELIFMPSVQLMLNYLFGRVRHSGSTVNLNMYLGLISPYGKFFKSSCCELAHRYFESIDILSSFKTTMRNAEGRTILMQAGSTEGFGIKMSGLNGTHGILYHDELSKMVSKSTIESASYSHDLLQWYGSAEWQNTITSNKNTFTFSAGAYCFSWQWCTTDRGFNRQWPLIAGVANGMEDRLFFLLSPKEPKEANLFADPDFSETSVNTRQALDKAVRQGVYAYENIAEAQRLLRGMDPRSLELAQMLALYFAIDLKVDGEHLDCITSECLERAIALVAYRNAARKYLDPIEADNLQGRLTKEILRELKHHGGLMKYRDLCRDLDYQRHGPRVWRDAVEGMLKIEPPMMIQWAEKTPSGRTVHMIGIPKLEDEE